MSKTVLIAEDYADIRTMMKILIQTYGYQVIEARDGYDAVEKAILHRPDLILMDLMMPIMDGITATQIIRKFEESANVPIIALTAYGNTCHKSAIEAGCDEVVNKPLDFENLKPLLNHYLA
jgi:two-component system, cell cycle response regulator DivK